MANSTRTALDHPALHWLQVAATLFAAAWAVLQATEGRLPEAAALAGVAVLGTVLLATRQRLAALFRLALLAAAFVNAAGYVLELWVQRTMFDETAHALTSFAGSAAVAWLLLGRTRLVSGAPLPLIAAATAVGVAVGIAWEVFEWMIGIIGDRRDTILDLAMDAVGAIAAGLFCAWAAALRRQGRA